MGLTERQATHQLALHAQEEEAKIIDYFNAVEQLHNVELNKIIPKLKTDARWATVPRVGKPSSRINVVQLIRGLPMHIMGCLLTKQPSFPAITPLTDAPLRSSSCYEHVSKAFKLLATLSDMCTEVIPHRDNGSFGPNPAFTAELIDAVNLSLLTVAGPEGDTLTMTATDNASFSQALHRASIVPAALQVLALIVSAQVPPERGAGSNRYAWTAVCEALFGHPRGSVLLDAAFEAARVLVGGVRQSLCSPSVSGENVYVLAYHAGATLELITALCASQIFYYRMMLHDPQGSAPLRLILSCLAIHDAPLAAPPFFRMPGSGGGGGGAASRPRLAATQPPYSTDKGRGAAELLAARGFALLLLLGEFDAPTYLDEVFGSGHTKQLAEQLVGRSAAYVGQVLLRPPVAQFPAASAESQMSINVLRAAELLSDDSNFRMALIPGLASTLAQLLGHTEVTQFASMWCLGTEAVQLMGLDSELLVNSSSKKAMVMVNKYAAASKEYHAKGMGVSKVQGLSSELIKMGRHLALERSILLAKLLVNLHYYNDTLPINLKDAFFKALIAALSSSVPPGTTKSIVMSHAVTNLENLFAVAWVFGPPNALKKIELVAEVDMEQSIDLLGKMKKAAAGEREVPMHHRPPREDVASVSMADVHKQKVDAVAAEDAALIPSGYSDRRGREGAGSVFGAKPSILKSKPGPSQPK